MSGLSYTTVQYSEGGAPVAKALVIELSTGLGIEIANDFVGFSRIAEALGKRTSASLATDLVGEYEVAGTELASGMPRTVRVRASSPRDARHTALNRMGIEPDTCEKVDPASASGTEGEQ